MSHKHVAFYSSRRMKITRQLRQIGEVVCGRDSVFYEFGAAGYRRLRSLLIRPSADERAALKNAMQLAAIARASKDCRPQDGAKHIVFFTVRGWRVHLATETMLAARLRQM